MTLLTILHYCIASVFIRKDKKYKLHSCQEQTAGWSCYNESEMSVDCFEFVLIDVVSDVMIEPG